jgi:hypothetical protein
VCGFFDEAIVTVFSVQDYYKRGRVFCNAKDYSKLRHFPEKRRRGQGERIKENIGTDITDKYRN